MPVVEVEVGSSSCCCYCSGSDCCGGGDFSSDVDVQCPMHSLVCMITKPYPMNALHNPKIL